jgi:type II secretory pathway pseudopilin PulG
MDSSVKSPEAGMSLLEVMMASMFMTIALLAVAGAMGSGIAVTYVSQEQLIAKQKAVEALESVYEARNTQQITFPQIQNVGTCTVVNNVNVCGIFQTGFQPIENKGLDGLPNTADDTLPVETLTYPGPDGILGTADDVTVSLAGYKRQITITTLTLPNDANNTQDPNIVRIDIDVQYTVNGATKTVRVSSLISQYS